MDENIGIIMRQTDYTEIEIKEKLITFNNNVVDIIEAYMGIKKPLPEVMKSVNQEKYKQFRKLMDDGSDTYRKKKAQQLYSSQIDK